MAGCRSSGQDLMPLKVGEKRYYMARSGLKNLPDNVEVTRQVAIGDIEGYELSGNLGAAHLGWSHGRLISDQMSEVRFVPPLPILAPGDKLLEWRGWVLSGDVREPAKASVTHAAARLEKGGRPVETVVSQVDLKISNRSVQLLTWFQAGVGIVRQEQRTNGRMDLMLEFLGS